MGSDWVVRRLGDVAQVLLSNVDKKSRPNEPAVKLCNYMDVYKNTNITADLPFMEATATAEQVEKFSLRRGDVMITKDSEDPKDIGVPACVVADFQEPVLCGYHLALLRPISIYGEYLAYALRSTDVNQQFVQRANGSTRFGLTAGVINDAKVPVPPLAEQKKIAQILSSVDEAIEATQAVIDQTRRVKEAMLQTLLTRGLGHTRFKQTEIGEIPEAWEVRRLGDVADVCNGSTPSRTNRRYWENGTVPWVASGKVNDYLVVEPSEYVTEAALAECSIKLLPAGTIILGMIGQGRTRGMSARLMFPSTINQNLAGVVPGDAVLSEFLHATLEFEYAALRASGRGSNQDALNCSIVKAFPIRIPPIHEQTQIVQFLTRLDWMIARNEEFRDAAGTLKSALLQTLLSGQTRVTP